MESKNFKNLLLMKSINSLGLSFINVFIPIYLLQIGYSFNLVLIFLSIKQIILLVMSFVSVYLSNKIGLIRNLQIRFLFLFLYIFLFYQLQDYSFLFYIIPVIIGIESALFWTSVNILFVRNTEDKNIGTSFSKFIAYRKFFAIFGPLIGGVIIVKLGYPFLFSLVTIILILAIMPLLYLKSEKSNFIFKWKSFKEIYYKNKSYVIPEIIDNLAEDAMIIWSIFVYLQLLDVIKIGFLETLITLTIIIFTLTIGKVTDKVDRKLLTKFGAVLLSMAWIFNFFIGKFFTNKILFYLGTIIVVFVGQIFLIPYSSLLYSRARKGDAQFII